MAGTGSINIQQVPKSKEFLECLRPRKGHVWVDFDFCLHPKTELLTKEGWIQVLDIQEHQEVWQVDPATRQGSWIVPSRLVKKPYEGIIYKIGNRRGFLEVTENHTMLWSCQLTKERPYSTKITKSQEGIPNTYYSTLLNATENNKVEGIVLTKQEIDLVALLQADAHYQGPNFVLQLSLPRKRKRAESLLGKKGNLHKQREGHNYPVELWCGISCNSPIFDNKTKRFHLLNLSPSCANDLVESLSFWDGSVGKSKEIVYCCTDEHNLNEVQAYLVRCGWEAKRSGKHLLTIRKHKGIRLRKGADVNSYNYTGMVGCVTVETGFILVRSEGQTFITGNCSLEPTLLTEMSRDTNMMSLYGPEAKANDIYLFVASQIPQLAAPILACGYHPHNPTKEAIARAKKECKALRSISKVLVLSSQYGAGPKKIYDTLRLEGVDISEGDVKRIHASYWQLFSGIKQYERYLHSQWRETGGWVLNPIGRPLTIAEPFLKDVVNRVIQSGGHDILVMSIGWLGEELTRRGIKYTPVVWDFHDECLFEVPKEQAEKAIATVEDMFTWINLELDMLIKLKGEVKLCQSLADAKIED